VEPADSEQVVFTNTVVTLPVQYNLRNFLIN